MKMGKSRMTQKITRRRFLYFEKSAEQGFAKAQFNLGVMHYSGAGVKQNYAEALRWYKKSAEAGHVYAQEALA